MFKQVPVNNQSFPERFSDRENNIDIHKVGKYPLRGADGYRSNQDRRIYHQKEYFNSVLFHQS